METLAVALDDPDLPDVGALLAGSDAWYAANYPAESNPDPLSLFMEKRLG